MARRLVVATAAATGGLAAVAVARWANGHAAIDLAIFDQGIWSASHGHGAQTSIVGSSLLADHFAPALLVFAPLYRLVATPVWLLVGQAIAAGVAVFLLCRPLVRSLGSGRAAALAVALLVSPPVAYGLLADVHPVVFAVPFAIGALLCAERGSFVAMVVLGAVAAALRVEVGVAVAVGAVLLARPGPARRRRGALAVLLAVAAAFAVAEQAIGAAGHWSVHYGHLGTSAGDALVHPWRFLVVLKPENLYKAVPWIVISGFVRPSRWRRAVPALIAALPILLSQWPGTQWWQEHYGLAPALLGAYAWLPSLEREPSLSVRPFVGIAALALLVGPVLPSALVPEGSDFHVKTFTESYAAEQLRVDHDVRCIVRGVPRGAGVSADMAPLTFLAHRRDLYLWPSPFAAASPSVLPGDLGPRPSAVDAAGVDYVITAGADGVPSEPPPGFVLDGRAGAFTRYRRTSAATVRTACAAVAGPASPSAMPGIETRGSASHSTMSGLSTRTQSANASATGQ
jgi:hypothetical protein